MGDLFTDSHAVISSCGLYRYSLYRRWDRDLPLACFIMLNPSTADAGADDPTIRKCVGFARRWDCGRITVVNLFAYRATDPSRLKTASDPIGPDNDVWIARAVKGWPDGQPPKHIICAWGPKGRLFGRAQTVRGTFRSCPLEAIRLAREGEPCHPLMLPYATPLRILADV